MKQEQFKLTKEEFIVRSMAGEKFRVETNNIFWYDPEEYNPFRVGESEMHDVWKDFKPGSSTLFTLVEPAPIIERRYQWFKDYADGETVESTFMSDMFASKKIYLNDGWYKDENIFRDVEIKK